jgi:hypothetical protein
MRRKASLHRVRDFGLTAGCKGKTAQGAKAEAAKKSSETGILWRVLTTPVPQHRWAGHLVLGELRPDAGMTRGSLLWHMAHKNHAHISYM